MNKVIKGIKLRLYPNQSQREQLWQMFGNDRFVWNQMLGMAKERYQNNPNSLFVNEYGMNYLLKHRNGNKTANQSGCCPHYERTVRD